MKENDLIDKLKIIYDNIDSKGILIHINSF